VPARSRGGAHVRLILATLTLGLLVGVAPHDVAVAVAVAVAAEQTDCSAYAPDDPPGTTDAESLPVRSLGIEEAHRLFDREGREPGAGVRVAVLDSGVTPRPGLVDVVEGPNFARKNELVSYHGSAVAGLIAGNARSDGKLVGVAPGAEVVDVRVYDQAAPTDSSEVGVTTGAVVDGLQWVAANADRLDIGVVNLSISVPPSGALAAAIRRVASRDVVVVAASGNRPADDSDPLLTQYAEYRPGEDAVEDVFPAGYLDQVVAVNATADGYLVDGEPGEVRDWVLQSSATDVAAPTYRAVTLSANGSTCVLNQVATSWAAAEVSGVVALLRSWYPDDNADQIVARLEATADGTVDERTVLTGAGVVQPVEALTRPLSPDRSGRIEQAVAEESRIPRATAPDPRTDPLAHARDRMVWWGLLGGAALVLALLLRPVLARRRR
jgi:membrane-anchored mycosin MYCP